MTTFEHSVAVTIVNYRTAHLVAQSLEALARERERCRAEGIDLRAIIVDNASGEFEELKAIVQRSAVSDWVRVLLSERNGGFAFGNNRAMRDAFENDAAPDFFFLLNPDAEVRPGAVAALARFLVNNPTVGIAGSSIDSADGRPWRRAFRFPSLLGELNSALELGLATRLLHKHVVAREMGTEQEPVDWVSGAALMLRRSIVEQLGGMDEEYFLYFEEVDFCHKVKNAGWSVWYVPSSKVIHAEGTATGMGTRDTAARYPAYWFESRRRYFTKNHGIPYACAVDIVYLLGHALAAAKRVAKGKSAEHVPHFARDLWHHSVLRSLRKPVPAAKEFRPSTKRAEPL